MQKRYGISAVLILVLVFMPQMLSAQGKLPQDLFSVNFPTETDGWACGRWGTIVHSEDGGETWQHQQSGTDFTLSSIFFVDPQNGWVVGDGGTILHSTDGGTHWVMQESPVAFFHMGVIFVNATTGWIVSERTHILYTEDGGANWQVQFNNEDFILKSISFCDEKTGWAVGEFGYIYHTSDGGKSWEHQSGDFGFSEETGDIVGGNFLYAVTAVDPSTAWATGIDGYVIRTTDGGTTWETVPDEVATTKLFCVASDGKGIIITCGSGILLSSSDNGKSFTASTIEPPIIYGWVYGLAERGDSSFVAVGKKGWIYLSDSGGRKWKRVAGG
jgi:photosystem II stability/assembly factor-like uncharacterized protein